MLYRKTRLRHVIGMKYGKFYHNINVWEDTNRTRKVSTNLCVRLAMALQLAVIQYDFNSTKVNVNLQLKDVVDINYAVK